MSSAEGQVQNLKYTATFPLLLNISDEQMSYVTNADAGCGLIKYGSVLVPFINHFPKNTKLYQLMTTKPGEGVFGGQAVPIKRTVDSV